MDEPRSRVTRVFRIDDFNPGFPWSRFTPLEETLLSLNIKPLIGVIPNSLDDKVSFSTPVSDFWDRIRRYQDHGWHIAQHGFTHVYDSVGRDYLGRSRPSEFSGHSFYEQVTRLAAGKQIMVDEGVWSGTFMPPGHSFDRVTLSALKELGFTAVTDGWGIRPYVLDGLRLVPQLVSRPHGFLVGTYTNCLHVGTLDDDSIAGLITRVRKTARQYESFDQILSQEDSDGILHSLLRKGTRILLNSKRAIR